MSESEPPPVNPYTPPSNPFAGTAADADVPLQRSRTLLRETRPWVLFLAILGMLLALLMMGTGTIGAIAMAVTGESVSAIFLPIYLVMGVLYLVPSLYLLRFASRIAEFVREGGPDRLNGALEAQRSFWRFVGIATVVLLVVYVGIMVVSLVALSMIGFLAG